MIEYPQIVAEDVEFTYAVSLVRALEVKLLSRERIMRMLEIPPSDLLKFLQDTDYARFLPTHPSLYESIITNSRGELFSLMEKLVPREYLYFLRLRYDLANMKALLRGRIIEKDVTGLLSPFGNYDTKWLEWVFREEKYYKLDGFAHAIEEAIVNYFQDKNSRNIDVVLDRAYYERRLKVSNLFYKTLTRIEIDLANLRTLTRIKWLNLEKSLLVRSIVKGGFISESELISAFDANLDEISQRFSNTPYYSQFSHGIDYLIKNASFVLLDRLCDEFIYSYIYDTTKYMNFGIEPVLAYFFKKENEHKVLRIIFAGKLNGIPNELIKERLPLGS